MKKLMLAAVGVMTIGEVLAGQSNRPPADGPYADYYFLRTDFSSVYNNASGQRWTLDNSITYQPQAGGHYYLGPDATFEIFNTEFTTGGKTFAGDELVVAGTILHDGAWSYKLVIPNCVFLPGSMFRWTSQSYIQSGNWTIKGTAENPVVFQHSGTTADYVQKWVLSGDSTAYLRIQKPDAEGKVGQSWEIADAWPSFYGTVVLGNANTLYKTTVFSTPGHLVIENASEFDVRGNSGTTSLGGLELKSGATFKVGDGSTAGTQTVRIEDNLTIAAGATVTAKRTSDAPALFDLSAAAYAAGVPDDETIAGWNVTVADTKTWCKWLPRSMMEWEDGTAGRKSLVAKARPLIQQTKHANLFSENSMTRGDVASFWDNTKIPEAGNDYQSIGKNVVISPTTDYWTFPGESFTFSGATFKSFCRGIAFKTLSLGGGASCSWRWNEGPAVFTGNLNFHEGNATIYTGGGNEVRINGPITEIGQGSTTVNFRMYGPYLDDWSQKYSYYSRAFWANLELHGDNRGYNGTMNIETMPSSNSDAVTHFSGWGMPAWQPSAVSNLTLRVYNNTNLVSGSLVLNNCSRLELMESAVFDHPMKKLEFSGATGYLRTPAGVSATLSQAVTYGSGTTVIKEGAGALYLGGTSTASGDTPELEVKEGYLGLVTDTAASALKVTVDEGAGLAVKVGGEAINLSEVEELEYDESGDDPKLTVAIDMSGLDDYAPSYTVPVFKYSSASGYATRFDAALGNPKLVLIGAPAGYRCVLNPNPVDIGDGMVQLTARVFRQPMSFIIK